MVKRIIRTLTFLILFLISQFALSQKAELLLQNGHSSGITSFSLSPDKSFAITGSTDQTVILWGVNNRVQLKSFDGFDDVITSVAVSAQKKLVLVGDQKGYVYVKDIKTKKTIKKITSDIDFEYSISQVVFSPNGSLFAFACYKHVYIYDTKTLSLIKKIKSAKGIDDVQSIVFSDDGKLFASDYGGGAIVWSTNDFKPLHKIQYDKYNVTKISFLKNGRILMVQGIYEISLWDTSTGKKVLSHIDSGKAFTRFMISPELNFIVSQSRSLSVYNQSVISPLNIYDLGSLELLFSKNHSGLGEFVNDSLIVETTPDGSLRAWSITNPNLEFNFTNKNNLAVQEVLTMDGDEDNLELIYGGVQGTLTKIDLDNFLFKTILKKPNNKFNSIVHNHNSNLYYVSGFDGSILEVNSSNFISSSIQSSSEKLLFSFYDDRCGGMDSITKHTTSALSVYGNSVISGYYSGSINLFKSRGNEWNKQNVFDFSESIRSVGTWFYSFSKSAVNSVDIKDQSTYVASYNNNVTFLFRNGEIIELVGYMNKFSPKKDVVYLANNKRNLSQHYLQAFDYKNEEVIKLPIEHSDYILDIGVSSSGRYIATAGKDEKCSIYDFKNQKTLDLIGHKGPVTAVIIFEDRNIVATGSKDNTIRLWNLSEGTEIVSLYTLTADGEYLVQTPDNYYFGSKNSVRTLMFELGEKVYSFEQFDLKYNRPDIILDRLGYADIALVEAYHQAYLKRLKKMGFTEEMLEDDFHLPEIKIENFEEMPAIYDQGSINLKLKLQDSKYKLDRINVWVNDVAIYGINGISLRDKNIQDYQTDLEVFLAKGKNKVQVSVLNQAGAESYKETFEIECTVGKKQPDLYLITIGESEFQQSNYNLTYAAKDAQDMVDLFEKSKVYKNVYSKTLVNEQVTKENILALKSFIENADINDEVMIFIAGHGVLDANLDYYFATYDMDFMNPAERGLAYEDLESLLDGIKPLKKTLLIDACHSGEIDKEEVELAQANITEESDIQFRVVGNTATPKLGAQNTSELTKSLFTDLRKGTGATVISSAGGMEFAMEGDDWKNGLFTYCFIKGIKTKAADLNKDGEIWLSEIQQYVAEQVYVLSSGRQQPTSRIENQTIDFRVW